MDHELRETFHMLVVAALANGENNGDGLTPQTPGGELQGLGRRPVKPLHIVHDADEGALVAYLRQQPRDTQADQEETRGCPAAQA